MTFNKDQIDRSLGSSIELIAAGGISNLIDRFIYNGVIDFISLSFFGTHLFVCNLADIYITLGAIMLLLRFRRPKQPGFKNILFKEDNL
jgi:signal peptidase II